MNLTDPLLRLFLKLLCVRSKICVFIPENLIRDLTCQYYTDVRLLMDCLTDQIHSDGSSDRRDIVSSKRLDNRFKCPDNIFFRDDDLVVVGVDIGSDKHYARAILARGFEVSKKPFEFANTRDGFDRFVNWSFHLAVENHLTKIFVALEPTGHYWFNLADYLRDHDVKLVLVAPQHVKHSKEMDDNTQTKNDRKDPLVIAKLVTEGRYMFPYIPEDIYAELRVAFNRRCDLVEALSRNENRMIRWFDIYFPEYKEVYGKANAILGLMILMRALLPSDILTLGVEGICQTWREAKIRAAGINRAKKLVAAAERSIGRKGCEAVRQELWQLMEEHDLLSRQLSNMMQIITELLARIPGAERLLNVPGAGVITVAGFLSEVGDISRFTDPKQIQKLAGLAIVENSSGK